MYNIKLLYYLYLYIFVVKTVLCCKNYASSDCMFKIFLPITCTISNIAHGQISYNEYFPSSKFRDRIIIKSHQHFHFHSVKRKVLTLPCLHNTF